MLDKWLYFPSGKGLQDSPLGCRFVICHNIEMERVYSIIMCHHFQRALCFMVQGHSTSLLTGTNLKKNLVLIQACRFEERALEPSVGLGSLELTANHKKYLYPYYRFILFNIYFYSIQQMTLSRTTSKSLYMNMSGSNNKQHYAKILLETSQ